MGAITYLFVAVLSLALGFRTLSVDRMDLARREFALLASLICLSFTGLGGVLLSIEHARWLFALTGAFLPPATLQLLDRLFPPADSSALLLSRMRAATVAAVFVAAGLDLIWGDLLANSWPKIGLGVLVYLCFILILRDLWLRRKGSSYRVERARILYVSGLMSATVVLSLLESLCRVLPIPSLPPLSALIAIVLLYLLYQVLSLERLLDLQELLTRLAGIGVLASLMVMLALVAVISIPSLTEYPLHFAFQIFGASVLFLLIYEPLHHRLDALMAQRFNLRGRALAMSLDELEEALPRASSTEDLAAMVLDRLHASGRFPALGFYIYDTERPRYRLVSCRPGAAAALPAVAPSPFADAFGQGAKAYLRHSLERSVHDTAAARLRIMDEMSADLVLPFRSGELVLGWMALKDEDWSDGFSQEEISRLMALAGRCGVVIENLQSFEAVKERSRLAALGTMSAGLAHEIRNPLAGIKGAAQYLQDDELPPESADFLQIIVDEVDRLNHVVSGFLNYARPFELDRRPGDLNETARHVLSLIRAEGLPEGVSLEESLDLSVVPCEMDPPKVQQVLFNLVRNAIQAMPNGGVVRVSTRGSTMRSPRARGRAAVELSVSDQGRGVSWEDREKLFIPFYTTKAAGTGLGLALCQRIVDAHNGELEVRSPPRGGAEFIARFLAIEPVAGLEREAPQASEAPGEP